jgi:hypothetical protein
LPAGLWRAGGCCARLNEEERIRVNPETGEGFLCLFAVVDGAVAGEVITLLSGIVMDAGAGRVRRESPPAVFHQALQADPAECGSDRPSQHRERRETQEYEQRKDGSGIEGRVPRASAYRPSLEFPGATESGRARTLCSDRRIRSVASNEVR